MTFLALQGVRKQYGAVAAVDGVDLAVAAGSRTAIVGPSGSGKSTLLRLIAGFETPDEGRIALDGQVLAEDGRAVPAFRRSIGVVAQDGALFPHLSVADNVGFGLPRTEPGRAARIGALLEMVGLDASMLARRPDALSGGQQQRVALARALACKPRLMLLDEPFSALDAGLRVNTRKAVADLLGEQKIATILVTHDQEEALSFADQVAVMREGRLLQTGTPRELYLRPADPMIAAFLGEAIVLPALLADGFADCALGRIGVDDRQRRGATQIMLRPEQISLARPTAMPANRPASGDVPGEVLGEVLGEVAYFEFVGAACIVAVRVLNNGPDAGGGALPLLILRKSLADLPKFGDVLRIQVAGQAHVFDTARA